MTRFIVETTEHLTNYRRTVIEAETEEAARDIAEASDWSEWEEIPGTGKCDAYISLISEEDERCPCDSGHPERCPDVGAENKD